MAQHNVNDRVLSIEVSEDDALYRILRITGGAYRVMYVEIEDISVIPEDQRTENTSILRYLSTIDGWNNCNWTHLKLSGSKAAFGSSSPNRLQPNLLLLDIPRYELFQLETVETVKSRTSRVALNGEHFYMKLAVFPHQLSFLANELRVYHALRELQPSLIPRLAAYVYEQTPDRVIGFLCEAIEGKHPTPSDEAECLSSLHQLHKAGFLHGDPNRYNIIINGSGRPVFVDLENSTNIHDSESLQRNAEERDLVQGLKDDSRRGAPYSL